MTNDESLSHTVDRGDIKVIADGYMKDWLALGGLSFYAEGHWNTPKAKSQRGRFE